MTAAREEGTAPLGAPQLRRREVWVSLGGDYAAFQVRILKSLSQADLEALASDDEPQRLAALARVVSAHNDWTDEQGQPLPPTSDLAFWRSIPLEVAALIGQAIRREAAQLPN